MMEDMFDKGMLEAESADVIGEAKRGSEGVKRDSKSTRENLER
jgi:hypothetical protein